MNISIDAPEPVLRLRQLLRQQPHSAAQICAALAISQPTFSRLWASLPQYGGQGLRLGAARATRYALTRAVRELDPVLPVYRVDADGTGALFGQLHILHSDWYAFEPATGAAPQWLLGLPFWLQDLRPQGFLGRMIPAQYPELALPASIANWSDDDTLYFLARRGDDVAGNLILGNEAFQRFSLAPAIDAVPEHERASCYAQRAQQANAGDVPGSSAGGEQAKFTALVEAPDGSLRHVIVKFSPGIDTAPGRRWADLLVAEHLALVTLREFGIPASESQIVMADSRLCLEVARFDRRGRRGRLPVVSMAGVDTLLGALDQHWSRSTALLRAQGLLSQEDWERVCLLDVFGALIGNSDRHPGNLSLTWDAGGHFALAPVYDMLPMLYRPTAQGEVVARRFDPIVLYRLELRHLSQARAMALAFWQAVLADERISAQFKLVAEVHRNEVLALIMK